MGLALGLILAGIVMAVMTLQSRPAVDVPAVAPAPPSVISPEAIRARNLTFSERFRMGQDTFSPEAVRGRNPQGSAQSETFSPERFRVGAPPTSEAEETFGPERYRQWP